MTDIINSSPPEMVSKETESVSNSFLHRYYLNIMENTEQSSVKVERATKFLLLPEISKLVGDHTKARFLLSKGLTHDEVSEAFKHYYRKQKMKLMPSVPELVLHNVNQMERGTRNAIQTRYANNTPSGLSHFLTLCQRMIFLAGISTAFYYIYQKWCTNWTRDGKNKKEHKKIEEELNHIRSELQKISTELKAQQAMGKTNANLLSEINSLKAILVSRQYFEEKQNTKLSLPSWQLNSTASTSDSSTNTEKSNASTCHKECSTNPSNSIGNGTEPLPEVASPSAVQDVQPAENNTQFNENNNVKPQINGDSEEKVITNGDCISDTTHKVKKNGSKNKNSKSKTNENGNKTSQKQNGHFKVDVN